MFQVEKRDGTIAEFQMKKITDAIGKAFGAKDMQFSDDMLQMLALRVTADFQSKIKDGKISVESIQDSVENVLIQCGYAEVAKAYILYRKQREKIRIGRKGGLRMQLQIVIQLTAEPGKPGGRKPEDRRRESRICIRHESGTGSKDSIQPVAVNIQDVALIDGQLLIEQLMHMVRRNDDQRSFRNTGDSVV